MNTEQPKTDDLQKDFEQALEELVIVLAEICVHDFLHQHLTKEKNDEKKSK